jgi:mRNA interferase RelE/StbE
LKTYRIIWSEAAAAQRDKIDPSVRRRIIAKLEQAAVSPHRFTTRLVGSPFSRLRVGDWRVILKIEDAAVEVIIIEVKHRRAAYR